MSPG
jgi:hypothetical protein